MIRRNTGKRCRMEMLEMICSIEESLEILQILCLHAPPGIDTPTVGHVLVNTTDSLYLNDTTRFECRTAISRPGGVSAFSKKHSTEKEVTERPTFDTSSDADREKGFSSYNTSPVNARSRDVLDLATLSHKELRTLSHDIAAFLHRSIPTSPPPTNIHTNTYIYKYIYINIVNVLSILTLDYKQISETGG
jgi:hypothetical protein